MGSCRVIAVLFFIFIIFNISNESVEVRNKKNQNTTILTNYETGKVVTVEIVEVSFESILVVRRRK